MPVPDLVSGDLRWQGVDQFNPAQDVGEGLATVADNLYPEAGRLVLRPGFVAQFAAALGSPIYVLTPITQTGGGTHFWFAAGTSLYRFVPGATTPVIISLPSGVAGIVAADTVIDQQAGYVYVADASATGLLRFKPDGTGAESAVGLATPPAPGASLTSFMLPVRLDPLAWGGAAPTTVPVNYVPSAYAGFPDYTGTVGGNNVDGYWWYNGAFNRLDGNRVVSPFDGSPGVRADSPREYVENLNGIAPAQSTAGVCGIVALQSKIFIFDATFAIVDWFQDGEDYRCQVNCYKSASPAAGAVPDWSTHVDLRCYPNNKGERMFVVDCRGCPFDPIPAVRFHFESPR